MFVLKKYYKWEVVKIYYCRTEEKAKEILAIIVADDYIKNADSYGDITFEELLEYAWEDCGVDDLIRIEEFQFEEDKNT